MVSHNSFGMGGCVLMPPGVAESGDQGKNKFGREKVENRGNPAFLFVTGDRLADLYRPELMRVALEECVWRYYVTLHAIAFQSQQSKRTSASDKLQQQCQHHSSTLGW